MSPPDLSPEQRVMHYDLIASANVRPRRYSPVALAVAGTLVALALLSMLAVAAAGAAPGPAGTPSAPAIGQWTLVPPVTNSRLRDVQMVSGSDGWAVGENGAVLHYNGSAWQQVDIGTTNILVDVFMVSASDGFILAWTDTGSEIYRYNGLSWTPNYTTTQSLSRIHGSSPTNVWAVGLNTSVHWDGSQWTT